MATNKPKQTNIWKSISHFWQVTQWYILGMCWAATLLLGVFGYKQYHLEQLEPQPFLNNLYQSIQLVVLESSSFTQSLPISLELARWLAPALAAYTAIQAAALVFAEQFDRIRLRYLRNHVIVCGLGRRGYLIAEGFMKQGESVVVIEKDAENDYIEPCRDLGGKVLLGDAANAGMLSLAGVARAKYLVAVNGEDTTNAEIAVQARKLIPNSTERHTPLTCLVHIDDPKLCDLLHEYEFATSSLNNFHVEFFNVFDLGAQAMLAHFPPFSTLTSQEPQEPAHILIIGLGSMGRSLLVRAARNWREIQRKSTGHTVSPLRVTVVDRDAGNKVETLKYRYPNLAHACSINSLQMDIRMQEFQNGDFLTNAEGEVDIDIVYVCLDNDSLGLSAGLSLNQYLRHHAVPVVIRTSNELGISGLWQDDQDSVGDGAIKPTEYKYLHAFGMLERTCQPERLLGGTHETIARALHQRSRQASFLDEKDQAGEPAFVAWDALSEDKRQNIRRQADQIGSILKNSGFSIRQLVDWDAEIQPFSAEEIKIILENTGNASNGIAFEQVPFVLAEAGLEVYSRPVAKERK